MKTLPIVIAASFALSASGTYAQVYGNIYPKSQSISTTGQRSGFNTGTLWDNSLGASWNYPAWYYAYGIIKAGYGDSQAMVSVSNGNFVAATTPPDQLGNFMNGKAYSSYITQNISYGQSARWYGSKAQFINFANGTTVGYGIRTSRWSGYTGSDAGLGYKSFLYSNWAYQPGSNPKVSNGAYSNQAWVRAGWLGPYGLNQPPLRMGAGRIRRWTIGEFTTAIDSRGICPYRYVFTTAENLTASTSSNIFIIPKSDQSKFLNGSSFSSYAKLFNSSSGQEVVLHAGRTYCIAVRDGVNTTSSEGAQVTVYGQYYR